MNSGHCVYPTPALPGFPPVVGRFSLRTMFAISTNWNSRRCRNGEQLVEEALSLGFDGLELGYALAPDLAGGLRRRQNSGDIAIVSVHAYCPVPLEAPGGHPELHLLADPEEDARMLALLHMTRTLQFAAEMRAGAVVVHAGRVPMRASQHKITALRQDGITGGWRYRWIARRLAGGRERGIEARMSTLRRSLDHLLPLFERAGITLCLENLPSWNALPNAREMEALADEFSGSPLRYWHDLGHGQIRELIGLEEHFPAARRLLPLTRGIHIHDVDAGLRDHLAPGKGAMDFSRFAFYGGADTIRVLEPGSEVTPGDLQQGLATIKKKWRLDA